MNGREQWVALQTLIAKEMHRFSRIWVQTLLPPVITTTLYFVIFGQLIGSRIGTMNGYPYMTYIVPGLIMMAVINSSYSNVVSSFFGAKFQRHIEELLISPMPNYLILTGFVAGGVARGLLVGGLVTAVALVFTDLPIRNGALTLSVVVVTAVLFATGGLINGIFARTFDDVAIIPTFVLTPLTYLGGVFYSVELLPQFWQGVSLANPILYMVNAFRYGVLGTADIPVGIAFGVILAFTAGLLVLALTLLNRGVGLRT